MIHCLRITPSAPCNTCPPYYPSPPYPIPNPLPSEALILFLRVHSLSWFIPVWLPPFVYPFLLLPNFLVLMFHRWEKPYDNCLSVLDLFHIALSPPVPSCCSKCWEFVLSDSWVIFHCIYGPQLLNPVMCLRTSRLLPWFSYCGQCCYEHWGAYGPSLHYVRIFAVNIQ